MKKQQIKQLAVSIIENGEITDEVSKWIFNNLTKNEIKLLLSYLVGAVKSNTVMVKYAGVASYTVKNKIQKMFPNKNIVYNRDDKEVGAGVKLEFGDYILDYTLSNMVAKIMKDIRESL